MEVTREWLLVKKMRKEEMVYDVVLVRGIKNNKTKAVASTVGLERAGSIGSARWATVRTFSLFGVKVQRKNTSIW